VSKRETLHRTATANFSGIALGCMYGFRPLDAGIMLLRNRNKTGVPARTASNERIYAIGDVHGRYDLLRDLLDMIEIHSSRLPGLARPKVMLLGDIVDRGPDTAKVMRFLATAQRHAGRLVVLCGNHEEMMLRVIDGDEEVEQPWLDYGGIATLQSFGIALPETSDRPGALGRQLRSAMPADLIQWLRELRLSARSGDYFFCHAGVRPGVRLDRQNRDDLMWIRDEFLHSDTDHGAVVVHGHSESIGVEVRTNRIGLDTGAYRTGALSCLYLEGTKRDVLTATNSASWLDRRRAEGLKQHTRLSPASDEAG
jgi:serine/threonine protein phosphatase 1